MKQPMRIIEGSAKPFEAFWRVRNEAESESGETEIEFYGYISEYSWFGDEITPSKFKADLAALEGKPVTVRIHSGGGDVFAASAIRAMLMDYPGKVTTRIDGLCASAATYVAMAGDEVLMQDSAFFMIHNPAAMAYGTVEDLRAAIKLLKTVKDGIVQTYQSKTRMEGDAISKLMDAETWMTAQEAQAMGFVDQVIESRANVRNVAILNCLQGYANVPEDVLKMAEEEAAESQRRNQFLKDHFGNLSGTSTEETEGGDPIEFEGDPIDQLAAVQQAFTAELAEGLGPIVSEMASAIQETIKAMEDEENVTGEESTSVETEPEAEEIKQEAEKLMNWLAVFGPRKEGN